MTEREIDEASVSQLIRAVKERESYAFLIGAGSSVSAGIPTGGQLIETWKEECHEYEDPDEELDEWVDAKEEAEMGEDEGEYGFWFEQRHRTRGERRERIRDLVEGKDPTLGHILLATMMGESYVPVVLTPNFDDLLFDAFYLYLEDRPQLINHRAIAPEYKLTRDRPAIVKLHGDYLYDNLRNTTPETDALGWGMEEALKRTVNEYGLVVIGYSGGDDSIMKPLLDADISEYGIYWCERSPNDISGYPAELLERENTYLVEIDGFDSLMTRFGRRIEEIEPPGREELIERAEQRADKVDGALEERKEETTDEEESEALDIWLARKLIEEGENKRAIEILSEIIDQDPESALAHDFRGAARKNLGKYEAAINDHTAAIKCDPDYAPAYHNRGNVKDELGEYDAAIEDFTMAIKRDSDHPEAYNKRGRSKGRLNDLEAAIEDYTAAIECDPENILPFLNRAEAKIRTGNFDDALEDAHEAKSLSSSPDETAMSLLLLLVAKVALGEDTDEEEKMYRSVCEEQFNTIWEFVELDSWLETADLEPEQEDKIAELIDLLREHKE